MYVKYQKELLENQMIAMTLKRKQVLEIDFMNIKLDLKYH